MACEELVARNWIDAIELLYADSWQNNLLRHRSHLAFRGSADAAYTLKTSLIRLGGPYPQLEQQLIRNFRKYARTGTGHESYSDWKWLVIGQHHGLPTRLLDWTYSPFAALHFCTSNIEQFDQDGVVWCVDYTEAHRALPKALKDQLAYSGSDLMTVEMIERAANRLEDFDALNAKPFAVFFEPPSLDERIVNQFALFSVLSDSSLTFDEWLRHNPCRCRRVIIPSATKWEIRDKLDQANLTERVFFPGLDGLAAWLKRYYSTREHSKEP